MADWQNKLENSIKSLENQSELLKSAAEFYDKIKKLQNDLVDSYLEFAESKSDFNEVSQRLKKDLVDFKSQIDSIKETSANELLKFNKSNNSFQEKFITNINELENLINSKFDTISLDINSKFEEINNITQKNITSLENGIQKKIQELYQDNKNFQKELDASLITRLDKHKSDIQVEVRNEGAQIQRGFETTLNSNFNSLESKLKEFFDVQSKRLNMLKILIFVTIGIGIGLAIGLYLK